MQTIHTDRAPAAIGPYSQAILAGNQLYSSGQIPIDPATGELVQGDITAQAEQVMKNLSAVLRRGNGVYPCGENYLFPRRYGGFCGIQRGV